MTHDELVERDRRWLFNTRRCAVVLTELAASSEQADAIGWTPSGDTILVECKASRSDFWSDRKKICRSNRRPDLGMGNERFYMVPAKLVSVCDVDKLCYYFGLLYVHASRITVEKKAQELPSTNKRSEALNLLSALRRLKIDDTDRHANIRVYTDSIGTVQRASITITQEAGNED